MTEPRGVYLLSATHAGGLRALSAEPEVAAVLAVRGPLSPEGAAAYIAAADKAREAGNSYVFMLTDRSDVLGVCRLIGVRGVPRLIVAVGRAYRGQGNGSVLVKHVLEFAFDNLKLEQVTATGACLNLVAQFGQVSGQALTRQEWHR